MSTSRLLGGLTVIATMAAASCVLDRTGQKPVGATPDGGSGGMGMPCADDAECPADTCEVGTCEDSECRTLPAAVGTPCADDGETCDVASVCKKPLGVACEEAAECHSGNCADDVCCSDACGGLCASCVLETPGECIVIEAGFDPEEDCPGDAVCGGQSACAYGEHLWSMAQAASLSASANALAVDGDGNVIYVLDYLGSITVGTDTYTGASIDFVVVKVSSDGTLIWSKNIFGTGTDRATGVAVGDDGSVYVSGTFFDNIDILGTTLDTGLDDDGFLFKLDADGNFAWARQYTGPANNSATGVTMGVDGSVIVIGSFDGPHDINGTVYTPTALGDSEIWTARYGSDGVFASATVLTDPGDDYAVDVDVRADGIVLIGGTFEGTFNDTETAEGKDAFVLELAGGTGQIVTAHTWGGPGNQQLTALTHLGEGFAIAGTFNGYADLGGGPLPFTDLNDAFVAVFDEEVSHVWSEELGGAGQQRITDIATDDGDNLVIVGSTYGQLSYRSTPFSFVSGEDPFIAKISRLGTLVWHREWGGAHYERLERLAIAPDDSIVALGELGATTINAGGADLVNADLFDDVFVVKLTP